MRYHGVLTGRQLKDDYVSNLCSTLLGIIRTYTCEMRVASVVFIFLSPLSSHYSLREDIGASEK